MLVVDCYSISFGSLLADGCGSLWFIGFVVLLCLFLSRLMKIFQF